jgi:CRP-like cAMP-binding protein
VTLDQDVAFLQSIPLFSGFPSEQLRLIAFSAEPLRLPEGTMLFREGAEADGGYVVVTGAVELSTSRADGSEDVAVAGPGALIGELALLTPTTRPVTAMTIEPTELLSVSRRLLRRVLEEYPDMAERLRAALSDRLKRMSFELGQVRERLDSIPDPEPEKAD